MKPIIVDVDPGTTTAISMLDIDGNIVDVYSKVNLGVNDAIDHILSVGYPIAFGTDKKKVPWFVGKLARTFSCKVFSPKEDMSAEYRKKVLKDADIGSLVGNAHEYDAYSISLFVFGKVNSLIRRIKKNVPDELWGVMLRNILNKKFVSIKQGLSIFEDVVKEEHVRKRKKEKKYDCIGEIDRLKLIEKAYYEKIKELKDELRKKDDVDSKERKRHRDILKSRTISNLMKRVEELETKNDKLENDYRDYKNILYDDLVNLARDTQGKDGLIIVPKVKDLGRDSMSRLVNGIRIIYLENIDKASNDFKDIEIVISKKSNPFLRKNFNVVNAKILYDLGDFVVIHRNDLNNIIEDVIMSYKKRR